MRGVDGRNGSLFSYVDLEERVPAKYPLRLIRRIADGLLAASPSQIGSKASWPSMGVDEELQAKDDHDDGPGRNAERDFRGEKRSNDTHVSTIDADAPLYKKVDGRRARCASSGPR